MRARLRPLLLAAVVLVACKGSSAPPAPAIAVGTAAPPPNFELACRSSNTATAAELYCVRTDTRSGDIVRVKHMELPTSNGPTVVEAKGPPGRFTTECDATSTDTRADLYCVRLNTETGEMLLINLQKVPTIPSR